MLLDIRRHQNSDENEKVLGKKRRAFFVVEALKTVKTVNFSIFFPKFVHFLEKKDPKIFSPAKGFFSKKSLVMVILLTTVSNSPGRFLHGLFEKENNFQTFFTPQ